MNEIMIVDDELAMVEVLREFLTPLGYRVGAACNGNEALERIRRERPRVVLLDVRMPGMGGVEALLRIKEEMPEVAVIMLSAVHEDELARQCMKMGASDYITKPIDLGYLERSIMATVCP